MALLDALEDLLRMGRDEDAYEQIKEEKGISSQILLNEGIFYGISADYDLSIAYLKLAVKIAEDEAIRAEIWHGLAVSYNNRGTTYRDLTQQEMVGEEAILAEILRPQPMSYNNQGDAYRDLKQPEKAIEDYNKAIKLDPRYARAYYNRGNAYRDLKEPEKAIEDYNKAIELNPGYATAYNNRGISYRDLKQPEKAIEDYNKAIELDPRYAAAYNNRGTAHLDLKQPKKAIEDYNKAIELNFRLAPAYANRGITRLLANVAIGGAIADFKEVRAFFDGANRERMLGFIQWAEARKAMNRKNWADFRAKLAEARVIFEKTDNPLSQSLDAFVELSYIDEKLDGALKVPDAIEASKQIEAALKTLPTFDEEIDPERTIFSARIASFVILQEFISSLVHFEENTDLGLFEANLDNLLKESEKVEETFKSVNFIEGKKSIVMLQNIISLVRQEVDTLRWAADKKQKVIEILKEYWSSRFSPAISAMNGVLSRETESTVLGRQTESIRATLEADHTELKEMITKGYEETKEEIQKAKKEILEEIYRTQHILLQKDVVNARYRIKIQAPIISSLSPISPEIIIELPMGNLTEGQLEEEAQKIVGQLKYLTGKGKEELLETLNQIPKTGKKLLKYLKKIKNT